MTSETPKSIWMKPRLSWRICRKIWTISGSGGRAMTKVWQSKINGEEMKQTCGYEGCGEGEDHPRHYFKTINMPISLANHQFQPQPAAQAGEPEWKQVEVAPESASPERAYPKPEIPAAKEPKKLNHEITDEPAIKA